MNVICDIINCIKIISRLISFSWVIYDIRNLSIWYWGRYLIWFYVTSNWYNFDINFDIIYDVIMTLVKSTSYWYHYWYHLWHLLDMDIWYHIDIMMSIFAARVVSFSYLFVIRSFPISSAYISFEIRRLMISLLFPDANSSITHVLIIVISNIHG